MHMIALYKSWSTLKTNQLIVTLASVDYIWQSGCLVLGSFLLKINWFVLKVPPSKMAIYAGYFWGGGGNMIVSEMRLFVLRSPDMSAGLIIITSLFYHLFLIWYSLSCFPANLAMRRKLHRHHCSHRRCMPLHSRVPFPWGTRNSTMVGVNLGQGCSWGCGNKIGRQSDAIVKSHPSPVP